MPATSDIQRCMSTVCEASAMVSRCGLYSPRGGGNRGARGRPPHRWLSSGFKTSHWLGLAGWTNQTEVHICRIINNFITIISYCYSFITYRLRSTRPNNAKWGSATGALIAMLHAIFKQSFAKCHIELWKIKMLIIFYE